MDEDSTAGAGARGMIEVGLLIATAAVMIAGLGRLIAAKIAADRLLHRRASAAADRAAYEVYLDALKPDSRRIT